MPRDTLTPEQQKAVRAFVQPAIDKAGGQVALAKIVGLVSHAQLSKAKQTGGLSGITALRLMHFLGEDPEQIGLPSLGRPLRALPSWGAGRVLAIAHNLPESVIEEAGGFIPPIRLRDIPPPLVVKIVEAWQVMRQAAADTSPAASPAAHATHAPDDAPGYAKHVAPFGVAGARAVKKRSRQAT